MANSTIYERFIELCDLNEKKPSAVAKDIGISPSNIKRWEEGSTINSDIIGKIAEYFNISAGLLYSEKPLNKTEFEKYKLLYSLQNENSDYLYSLALSKRNNVDLKKLLKISEYMKCSLDDLVQTKYSNEEIEKAKAVMKNEKQFLSAKEEILIEILGCLAGSKEFLNLQCGISIIILKNLIKKGIKKEDFADTPFLKEKISNLSDMFITNEKAPLYIFDLQYIFRKFGISTDYMLTGEE